MRTFCPDNLKVPIRMFPSESERFADPLTKEVYDVDVSCYISYGEAHLVGRQVPTCLALTSLGTRIDPKDVDTLLEMGFHLKSVVSGENVWKDLPIREASGSTISASQKTFFSDLMKTLDRGEPSLPSFTMTGEEEELAELETEQTQDTESESSPMGVFRFVYEDPFKINAAAEMRSLRGDKPMKILSWPGGVKRLTDNIPPLCLKAGKEGVPLKRGLPFYKVRDPEILMNVLDQHTHWGKRLNKYVEPTADNHIRKWALTLRKRIRFFLEGKHDPAWSLEQVVSAYGSREYTPRETKYRSLRFMQILETVDGLFVQTYLSDLTAGWSWERFDNYVLGTIHHLLGDEFLDGELQEDFPVATTVTVYEGLKAYRGQLKEDFLRGRILRVGTGLQLVLSGPVNIINRTPEGIRRTQLGAIITQTRGCGTPPPLVVLKAKMKFIRTVNEAPPPLEKGQMSLIRLSVQQIVSEIPDHVFTGLTTKAGVSVTTSACIEQLRADGGSSEYVRTIVREGRLGRPVIITDLNTGLDIKHSKLEDISVGGYIFWRCLEEVLATKPEVLREAHLVMVKEPGKARTVTKAHAALKVILDLVNGICSYPLKKGVESSQSGMAQANHGWNFFTNLYGLWRDLTFTEKSRENRSNGPDSFTEEIEYADLFVGFTDYSEATDKMDHKIAQISAETWMTKCGIPAILRGIVHETCFKPRTIFFNATGPLGKIGEPTDTEGIRKITLFKGVLMGDPLTKVVLHIMNIVSRRLGNLISDKSVLKLLPANAALIIQRMVDCLHL
jgi:hypothetical protein